MTYKVLEINVDDLGFGGVFSLVKNVIAHKPDTLKIDIASIERFEKKENISLLNKLGANVYYIGYEKNKMIKQLVCIKNLKELIQKEKYDCVHIHADVANKLLVSGLAAKQAGVRKIILHSHAAGVDGKHRKLKKIFHICCRRFLKYIGTDFAACSDVAEKWMFLNICQAEINMVKNGIDLNRFRFNQAKRQEIRKTLGIKHEFVIGHVGRFAYQKNHDYLIDIFVAAKQEIGNIKLILVGEGDLQMQSRQKVADLGLSDDVIFYGISNKVEELFQAMDVFVLPSHFEGMPIVGVEAQASGLPVLFSDHITKEAKLTSNVIFLPITNEALAIWCEELKNMSLLIRKDTYDELTKRGFDIQDTVDSLLTLYQGR